MDFRFVAERLSDFFADSGHRFAVIGGMGLLAYGIERATFDLDLVTEVQAQDRLIEFLESEGYETLHRSAGYSNHLHPSDDLGRLDFVYVERDTAEKLFPAARPVTILETIEVLVPKPEHLIAMKVRAIKNDPSRQNQDLEDIVRLTELSGVDRDEVRSYFEALGLEPLYETHVKGRAR